MIRTSCQRVPQFHLYFSRDIELFYISTANVREMFARAGAIWKNHLEKLSLSDNSG